MNQSQPASPASARWILFIGFLLGGGLLAFMLWDSIVPAANRGSIKHSDSVIALAEDNWQKEVVESNMPVMVDFTAAWCPPCKAFAPTVEKIAKMYAGKAKVGMVNVGSTSFDQNRKITSVFSVDSIPRVMIFKGPGEPFHDFGPGIPSESDLIRTLDAAITKK